MAANSFLLFLESGVNVALDLVFDGVLAAGSDGFIFDILLNTPAFNQLYLFIVS